MQIRRIVKGYDARQYFIKSENKKYEIQLNSIQETYEYMVTKQLFSYESLLVSLLAYTIISSYTGKQIQDH